MCDHIMCMMDISAQLKSLKVSMSELFLVHYIFYTLPLQYSPFKISYNTQKDKWSINELLTVCVQEERWLLLEQGEKVLFTILGNQMKNKPKNKGKGKVQPKVDIKKKSACFFCKKKGDMKKNCMNHKVWLEKKGNSFSFICYKSNFINVNHNAWWIDSNSTFHVSNTLQGM